MKIGKIVLAALTGLGILVVLFMTMRPGLESSDPDRRLKAIEKTSDQSLLGQIAMRDDDQAVRIAAIEHLTDQNILLQIVLTDPENLDHIDTEAFGLAVVGKLLGDSDLSAVAASTAPKSVRQAAINKITDQDILGAALLTIDDDSVRLAGIERIANHELLVSVALSDRSELVRMEAFGHLIGASNLRGAGSPASDDRARTNAKLMSKVLDAYDALPDAHRDRLASHVLTIAHAMQIPSIAAEVELISIHPTWTEYNVEYSAGFTSDTGRLKPQTKHGEKFTIDVATKTASGPKSHVDTWETYFHTDTDTMAFRPARILVGNIIAGIYQDAFAHRSQTDLFAAAKNATHGEYEVWAGRTAARLLTDQDLILSLASDAPSDEIRRVAIGRVDDQNTLSLFARTDDDMGVRAEASRKLTDPDMLTRIALTDPALSVRSTATDRLTEQGVLERVPPSNASQDDRLLWIQRLTDQSLLAIVALEASQVEHRIAAVQLLDDADTLRQIAAGDDSETVRALAAAKLAH